MNIQALQQIIESTLLNQFATNIAQEGKEAALSRVKSEIASVALDAVAEFLGVELSLIYVTGGTCLAQILTTVIEKAVLRKFSDPSFSEKSTIEQSQALTMEVISDINVILGKFGFDIIDVAELGAYCVASVGTVKSTVQFYRACTKSAPIEDKNFERGAAIVQLAGTQLGVYLGASIGSVVPVVGTVTGALFGYAFGKAIAEAAPKDIISSIGPVTAWDATIGKFFEDKNQRKDTKIVLYKKSSWSFRDNDAKIFLQPIRELYISTELKLNSLADELWFFEEMIVKASNNISKQELEDIKEIYNTKINQYNIIKNEHARARVALVKQTADGTIKLDNPERCKKYLQELKSPFREQHDAIVGAFDQIRSNIDQLKNEFKNNLENNAGLALAA